jgi:signal transduction histidine kinase
LRAGILVFDTIHRFILSLSGQLAIMTAVFVTLVEIMILIPSLANDQEEWLINSVRKAEIASQAVDTADAMAVSAETSEQLRKSAGVLYLAVRINGQTLRLFDSNVTVPEEVMDLRRQRNPVEDIAYLWAPWQTLLSDKDRLIHVQTQPRLRPGDQIEIVVRGEPLKKHLQSSLLNMLRMSFFIALAAGILIFAALSFVIVRPIRKLTDAIQRFKTNPEDVAATPELSGRADEIGDIEHELVAMQEEVRNSLRSRARLAALGQAVSKINHDLRNMLTSAQMASDRLSAASADPTVAKALPRLERALDRALSLATNVLTYGKSDERAPAIQIVRLKDLAEAAAEDAGLCLPGQAVEGGVRFALKAPKGFHLEADPEQLHRMLVNLMRNARQAIELQPNRRTLGRVTLTAIKTADDVILIVADNGPGIPEKAREKLFQPFTSSNTPGGSGLGLAISRELAQLHGGDVRLVNTGPEGTSFEVRLPLRA